MTTDKTQPTVDEIRAHQIQTLERQLSKLRAEQADDDRAKRDAVKAVYKFTVTPVEVNKSTWDLVFDDSVGQFKVSGEVQNADELKSVGKSAMSGSMVYYFNFGTGKLIGGTGGGTVWINSQALADDVSAFIRDNLANGGDITEIVNKHRDDKS